MTRACLPNAVLCVISCIFHQSCCSHALKHARGIEREQHVLNLIDNHSRLIFADTANYRLGGLDEWRDSNSHNNADIERLSLLAARLLD
jgi:hypothetical protein